MKRNAPTILNTAFNGIGADLEYDPSNTVMFWDSRSHSLEDQARGPILSQEEMRGENYAEDEIFDVIATRLSEIPEYVTMFDAAFGDETIDETRILQALGAFTLHPSPFTLHPSQCSKPGTVSTT
ncbi:Cytochrome c551 peroxidase [BD1-7 clade bacterium]|uniref:Cytochrome c551 peroxidase n=1 Tax=BD1-7 clade bacterium TaxID=2029982 RepID=A0A5S9PKJ7_9GAMM|nr:Cytochrome c551 peroxidase [BD1-7 clade bacterium]